MYVGKLVRLRELRKSDTELALQYINDPEVRGLLSFDVPFPFTLGDEEKWIERQTAHGPDSTYNFAIETLAEKKYIGGCGLNRVDWKNRIAEVGIMIGDKSFWNRGYGTEALRLLLKFTFDEMNLRKATLNVAAYNLRAQKSYKKCGFVEEGRLRQEIFRGGKYYDKVIMGLLREEFEECSHLDTLIPIQE